MTAILKHPLTVLVGGLGVLFSEQSPLASWGRRHWLVSTGVLACAVVISSAKKWREFDKLARLVTLWPLCALIIKLERMFFPRLGSPFPTTPDELFKEISSLVVMLRAEKVNEDLFANCGKFISAERGKGLANEPTKMALSAVPINLYFESTVTGKTEREVVSIFAKLPSNRQLSLTIVSATCAFVPVLREIGVSQDKMEEILAVRFGKEWRGTQFPLGVPRPMLCRFNGWTWRALLVHQLIDLSQFECKHDSQDLPLPHLRFALSMLARFHAANWDPKPSVAPYVLDRRPLDHLGLLDLCLPKSGEFLFLKDLWKGLRNYFFKADCGLTIDGKPRPKLFSTVSHADYRPGNLLFKRTAVAELPSDIAKHEQFDALGKEELIVTDWEGLSITPFIWDVVYCILSSIQPDDRRKHMNTLFECYLRDLRHNGVPSDQIPPMEELQKYISATVLLFPLYCYGLLAVGAAGDEWGSNTSDMESWGQKITAVVLDVTSNVHQLSEEIGVSEAVILKLREHPFPLPNFKM